MKALITGGGGFIGSHLARELSADGHVVDLADDLSRGALDSDLRQLLDRPSVRLLQVNLLDPAALDRADRDYDVIFHLAAIVGVANVLAAPFRVLRENNELCVNMLRFAQAQTALSRFVFASTSEVYAGTLEQFGLEIPTPESAPLALPDLAAPRTSYLLSKIYGEALCHHSGVPFTVIRPHNVYGARMGLSHVVPALLRRAHYASDGGELEVFSAGHRRTFCFVDDAVRVIRAAADSPSCECEVLNVGSRTPEITIEELARAVLATVGRDLRIVPGPIHPGSPARRAPDTTRSDELTGQTDRLSLAEGLRRTYDWYRRNVFAGTSA